MQLYNAEKEINGNKPENVFFVRDEFSGKTTATCVLTEQRSDYYDCHYRVMLDITSNRESFDYIMGAVLARAKHLCRAAKQKTRVYAECDSEDTEFMELLRQYDFDRGPAVWRYEMQLPASVNVPQPEGFTVIPDQLDVFSERQLFIRRWENVYGFKNGEARVNEIMKKRAFRRFLCVNKDGFVGEAVCWVEGGRGIVGHLYTDEKYRYKGVGKYMLSVAANYCDGIGISVMRADIPEEFPYIISTCRHAGFERVRVIKRYPGIYFSPDKK